MSKYEIAQMINLEMVKEKLPNRIFDSYKGSFGSLLCVCGSKNMVGAAFLSVSAALKCGVGLIRSAVPTSVYKIMATKLFEVIFYPLSENEEGTISKTSEKSILNLLEKSSAVMIGCGLGWNNDVLHVVQSVLKNSKIPIILDADGINVISENIGALKEATAEIIITPHLGEAARLLNLSIEKIKSDKIKFAKKLAEDYGITVVLKSENTLIASKEGELFINKISNSGMSKAGCGDVLTGMISSFTAQRLNTVDAALCGVFLHSMAGENCKNQFSKTSMLPTNIINELPNLFLKIEK